MFKMCDLSELKKGMVWRLGVAMEGIQFLIVFSSHSRSNNFDYFLDMFDHYRLNSIGTSHINY